MDRNPGYGEIYRDLLGFSTSDPSGAAFVRLPPKQGGATAAFVHALQEKNTAARIFLSPKPAIEPAARRA